MFDFVLSLLGVGAPEQASIGALLALLEHDGSFEEAAAVSGLFQGRGIDCDVAGDAHRVFPVGVHFLKGEARGHAVARPKINVSNIRHETVMAKSKVVDEITCVALGADVASS